MPKQRGMIDIQVRIHDKFSIEFKVGYIADGQHTNDFAFNTWIFVPNSLDINSQTYSKERFYRDVKSNVRLITPVYGLEVIADKNSLPMRNLEDALHQMAKDPSREKVSQFEYEIKMFMAIFKSSVRDSSTGIMSLFDTQDVVSLSRAYSENISLITDHYRTLLDSINMDTCGEEDKNYFMFGDEFMSNIIEKYTFRTLATLEKRDIPAFNSIRSELAELLSREKNHRQKLGYPITEADSPNENREVVFRHSILKKYIESDLFLRAKKKRDGVAMEQFYLSLAAGISMVFATVIAFSFQQKYGNFTMPLFVALVVSYMLKDRIKEMMRHFFAYRLKNKYFDNKTTIAVKEDHPIGWIKEGMDFITDDKVPEKVMDIRSRSPLLQAENRISDEKIILFRKMVSLDSQAIRHDVKYGVQGINDIMRLHLTNFVQKMDNPRVPLHILDQQGYTQEIKGDKIYYLNFVIQMQHADSTEYKRYRIILNRLGIIGIEELK